MNISMQSMTNIITSIIFISLLVIILWMSFSRSLHILASQSSPSSQSQQFHPPPAINHPELNRTQPISSTEERIVNNLKLRINEIQSTEQTFYKMMQLNNSIIKTLNKIFISSKLFAINLNPILDTSKAFSTLLSTSISHLNNDVLTIDLTIPFNYLINNFVNINGVRLHTQTSRCESKLKSFSIKFMNDQALNPKGYYLTSCTIVYIQRGPRYKLFMQDINHYFTELNMTNQINYSAHLLNNIDSMNHYIEQLTSIET